MFKTCLMKLQNYTFPVKCQMILWTAQICQDTYLTHFCNHAYLSFIQPYIQCLIFYSPWQTVTPDCDISVWTRHRCAGEARAFNEFKRYHNRPSWFNSGPKNVHFGITHFRDFRIFWLITKTQTSTMLNFLMLCIFHYGT